MSHAEVSLPVASTSPQGGGAAGQDRHLHRQVALLALGCIAVGAAALPIVTRTFAARAELAAREQRATALAEDAAAILRCRALPPQAAEVSLPTADFLARVSAALQTAGLPGQALASTLPQPQRRLPGNRHAEIVNRLVFESVGLEPLVRFCDELNRRNPALRISGIQLRAAMDRLLWNADVSVSYLVVSPEAVR